MRRIITGMIAAAALSMGAGLALAQTPGTGPVAEQCKADLAKHCAGKSHQGREARSCLEAKKAELSDGCKKALDSTGGGQGKGQRKG